MSYPILPLPATGTNIRITEDERSIANKLEREARREKEGESESLETRQLKEDPTLPVWKFPQLETEYS